MPDRNELVEVSRGEFMRHANFCDALAVAVEEPAERAALSEMAERWRELAQRAPILPGAWLS